MRAKLDACLLTGAEMALGRAGWVKLDDPFPVWAKMPRKTSRPNSPECATRGHAPAVLQRSA